jgi:hypothetical protein
LAPEWPVRAKRAAVEGEGHRRWRGGGGGEWRDPRGDWERRGMRKSKGGGGIKKGGGGLCPRRANVCWVGPGDLTADSPKTAS